MLTIFILYKVYKIAKLVGHYNFKLIWVCLSSSTFQRECKIYLNSNTAKHSAAVSSFERFSPDNHSQICFIQDTLVIITTLHVAVTCPALPTGNNINTNVRDMTGAVEGTRFTYSCLDRYKPSADGIVTTCQPSGEWSLPLPACEPSRFLV